MNPLPVKRRTRREREKGKERQGAQWKARWGKYTLVRNGFESIPESKFPNTSNLIQGGDRRTSKLKCITRPIEARGILKAGRPHQERSSLLMPTECSQSVDTALVASHNSNLFHLGREEE